MHRHFFMQEPLVFSPFFSPFCSTPLLMKEP
jgi:hypothetical protein